MQIGLNGQVAIMLQNLRNKMTSELGSTPTWNMVIKRLLDSEKEVKRLKSLVKSKDEEIKRKTDEYLKLALQRPTSPVMAVQQNAVSPPPLAPPPKPPSLPPKPISIKASPNVKADFMKELKAAVGVANGGEFLKPSQVAKATGVKYDKIVEVEANDS